MAGSCFDLDECKTFDQHNCKPGATCINTEGSYDCICPDGSNANSNGECLGTGYENIFMGQFRASLMLDIKLLSVT